ncbi:DNA import protein CedB [Sulfuracidifex metallicus]|uniref:DUF87 domain-containing protein n=2 Tax=Sulfuracidifex metallicus TaxID=47303 RepID=A0A6A9QN79_SULME|nr:DUF87 domain-containing protein [Sulfuracidifex metallicus DSM 6482 = JCM 9184]
MWLQERADKFFAIFMIISVLVVTLFFIYRILSLVLAVFVIIMVIFLRSHHNSPGNVLVEQNIIKFNNNFYRYVLLVEDIRADYRDFSESTLRSKIASFYKVISTSNNIDIILRKIPVDKLKYIDSILNEIQNLRIIIENDPSNEKAKRRMEILRTILSKIEEGEIPFRYQMFLLISGKDMASVTESGRAIKTGLEAIGIRCREAKDSEISSILSSFILPVSKGKTKITTSFHIPFMTPFSIEKEPRYELIEDGIPLGKEILHSKTVFWNPFETNNRHAIVIGPSGSGKTEFLLWLGTLINIKMNSSVIFFDLKGDIKKRLRKYKIDFKVLNPLVYTVGSFSDWNIPNEIKIIQLESIISSSFKLNRVHSTVLYSVLKNSFCDRLKSWESIKQYTQTNVEDFHVKNLLLRIFDMIKYLEPFQENSKDILEYLDLKGINVIDLTLIKSDELRKYIIYSIITRIYNRFSLDIKDNENKISIIMDEAWTLLKDESSTYSLIADIIKKGRGHGISLVMSSQNLEDLGENLPIYVDNAGLLVVMNNGDKGYWNQIERFANVRQSDIDDVLEYFGQGEAMVRFLGDPRPLLVSLFTFADKK